MSDNKEDSLRKKAKSSLDPKGWEALLEGVPRIEDKESHEEPAEKTVKKVIEGPPSTQKNVFKAKDESGVVHEQAASKQSEKPFESKHETPQPSSGMTADKTTSHVSSRKQTDPDFLASSDSKSEHLESAPHTQPDQKTVDQSSREEKPPSLSKRSPTPESERLAEKGFVGRAWIWLQAQPLFQRIHHYYKGLNTRDKKIVQGFIVVLSILMIYILILSPLLEKNALLNRQIDKKTEDLIEINRLSYSVVQNRGGMDRINKIIDQRGVGFSIFAYLEQLASKAEMKDKIIYIKPQRQTNVGPFKESHAEIKLDNINLEELTRFLYEIETSEDLLYIKNVKMKTRSSGKNQEGLEVILSVGTLIKGG